MRVARSRHGDGASQVAQTVTRFVGDRIARLFFLETWRIAATLSHETGYYAVEYRAVIEPGINELEKIRDSKRCSFTVQFQLESSLSCNDLDVGMGRHFIRSIDIGHTGENAGQGHQ